MAQVGDGGRLRRREFRVSWGGHGVVGRRGFLEQERHRRQQKHSETDDGRPGRRKKPPEPWRGRCLERPSRGARRRNRPFCIMNVKADNALKHFGVLPAMSAIAQVVANNKSLVFAERARGEKCDLPLM